MYNAERAVSSDNCYDLIVGSQMDGQEKKSLFSLFN